MSDSEGTEALNKQCREAARPTFDRMRTMLSGQSPAPIAGKADEMPDVHELIAEARGVVESWKGAPHWTPRHHVVIVKLADALDKAQRERDAIAGRTYDACISIAEKVASHTDDLMRGAVRTQSSGGAGHAIGYGSAAREVVEQIEELRRAWPVLPDTTANLASRTSPEGKP